MARAFWTPLAEGELDEILYFIAVHEGRPETAERLYLEIKDAVNEHVRIGYPSRRHPALPENWSYLMHKRWLIAYEPIADGIIVHRVLDASRDLPKEFESQEDPRRH